jgi:menaquinone-dependent protoporphyrinogen oxidase
MKTLILYATKHGAAREIAARIAKRMDGAAVHDLGRGNAPEITGYDCVIIGGSVYAGAVRKDVKEFIAANTDALRQKRLGLFLSGMRTTAEKETFEANFPPALLNAAKAVCFPGGIFDPNKAGFLERMVAKAVMKATAYTSTIDDKKIERFVREMQA